MYCLRYETYDTEINHYFEPHGKNLLEFEDLCNRLMRQIAEEKLEGGTEAGIIDYMILVDEVAQRVPSYGYTKVEIPTVKYCHGYFMMPAKGAPEEKDMTDVEGDEVRYLQVMGYDLTKRIMLHNRTFFRMSTDS